MAELKKKQSCPCGGICGLARSAAQENPSNSTTRMLCAPSEEARYPVCASFQLVCTHKGDTMCSNFACPEQSSLKHTMLSIQSLPLRDNNNYVVLLFGSQNPSSRMCVLLHTHVERLGFKNHECRDGPCNWPKIAVTEATYHDVPWPSFLYGSADAKTLNVISPSPTWWNWPLVTWSLGFLTLSAYLVFRRSLKHMGSSLKQRPLGLRYAKLFLVLLVMVSAVAAVKGWGDRPARCLASDVSEIESEADQQRNQTNLAQVASQFSASSQTQTTTDISNATGPSNQEPDGDQDLQDWITAQVARIHNPLPFNEEEDPDVQALQSRQDSRTRLALSMVGGNQAGSNVVQAILRHQEARALMEAAHRMHSGASEQPVETPVVAEKQANSYAKAAGKQKQAPPPPLVYNNSDVRRWDLADSSALPSVRQLSANLFRTSVTPVTQVDLPLPGDLQVVNRCSAVLGMHTMRPDLRGPGRLVVHHPLCPYHWQDIVSNDASTYQQIAGDTGYINIVVIGLPRRATVIQVNQRLISLGLRPHETHTVLLTTRGVYRAQHNIHSPVLTAHAEVRVDNTPRVWRLLAGESAYPWAAGQDAITTYMLGFRLHQNHAVHMPVTNTPPDMLLSSYLHAGGFQEEQVNRFYAMALRRAGYDVWWVAFYHATPAQNRNEYGTLIPWHHIQGGIRLVFPTRTAAEQAFSHQSRHGSPRITMAMMAELVPDFHLVQPVTQTILQPLTLQTLRGMYMDLHLTALREPGTPPTQLRFENDEHTRAVVFFPTEGQSNAITARYGTHVGPIHEALTRAVSSLRLQQGPSSGSLRIILSFYPDTNIWYPSDGIALIFPTRDAAETFMHNFGMQNRGELDPVAHITGREVDKPSHRTRVHLASSLSDETAQGKRKRVVNVAPNDLPGGGRGRGRGGQGGGALTRSSRQAQGTNRGQGSQQGSMGTLATREAPPPADRPVLGTLSPSAPPALPPGDVPQGASLSEGSAVVRRSPSANASGSFVTQAQLNATVSAAMDQLKAWLQQVLPLAQASTVSLPEPSSSSAASSAQSSAPEQGEVNEPTIGDDHHVPYLLRPPLAQAAGQSSAAADTGSTSVEDVPGRRSTRRDTGGAGGAAAADGTAKRASKQTNKATAPADSAKAAKKGNGSPPSRTSS